MEERNTVNRRLYVNDYYVSNDYHDKILELALAQGLTNYFVMEESNTVNRPEYANDYYDKELKLALAQGLTNYFVMEEKVQQDVPPKIKKKTFVDPKGPKENTLEIF